MKTLLKFLLLIFFLAFISANKVYSQCTVAAGCNNVISACANITTATTTTTGTAGAYYVYCIAPPAGCGVITIDNFTLSQYSTVRICTSSPTDTVKFTKNFTVSGSGGPSTDNTRRLEVNGNVQMTFGGTVSTNSKLIITVATNGTLDLRPALSAQNPLIFGNIDSIYNSGKIISNGPVSFTGPVSNKGSITAPIINFSSGVRNYNNAIISTTSTMSLMTGANVINYGSVISGGAFTSSSGSFFDNNNYWYSNGDATFNGSYANKAWFKSDGTIRLNAGGSLDVKGGLFDSDNLILNAGLLSTGTGCAVFRVRHFTSIQNGSGISATPPGSTGILDMNNPGEIDNVACGCGSTDNDQIDNAISPPTGTWCSKPAAPNSTGPYCGIVPISSFTGGPGGCFSTLPITWLSLNASKFSPAINLVQWTVEENKENFLYAVEYSYDGIHFSVAGTVQPDQSRNVITYSFNHVVISDTDYYYRVRQVDKNGKESYSKVVFVGAQAEELIYIFPNPANDFISILSNRILESAELYSVDGKLIKSVSLAESMQIQINDLSSGVYFVKVYGNNKITVLKLLKDK